jgi:cobalt-zinc-cadmium efflux system protein
MAHQHSHGHVRYNRAFTFGIMLNVMVVLLEIIFGLRSHSLALLSDAGHNASDVLGLLIAGIAVWLSRRNPTERRTYGLFVVVGALGWAAVERMQHPEVVASASIILVASIGLILNLATAFLFRRDQHDLNMRGAYLHMLSDAMISAGVIVAGLVMQLTGWLWLDAGVSLVIGIVIAVTTWRLLVDSFNLAMDAVPEGIDLRKVSEYLTALPGVCEVHDLHVWAMSTTEAALTVHLVSTRETFDNSLLDEATEGLHALFGIHHPTLQIERVDEKRACALSDPAHV